MCEACNDTGKAYQLMRETNGTLIFGFTYEQPSDEQRKVGWATVPCPRCNVDTASTDPPDA